MVITNYHAWHHCSGHLGPFDILWADEVQHLPLDDILTVKLPWTAVPTDIRPLIRELQEADNLDKEKLEELSQLMTDHAVDISVFLAERGLSHEYREARDYYDGTYRNKSFEIRGGELVCRPVHPADNGRSLFFKNRMDIKTYVGMSGTLMDSEQIGVKDEPVHFFAPQLPSPMIRCWNEVTSARDVRFARARQAESFHPQERGVLFFNSRREAGEYHEKYNDPRHIMQVTPGARCRDGYACSKQRRCATHLWWA